MTAKCPHCASPDFRLHAVIFRLSTRRRFFLFGVRVPTRRTVGFDASCLRCLYAFSVIGDDVIIAPAQMAHETLKRQNEPVPKENEKQPRRRAPVYDIDLARDPRDRRPK